MPYRIRKAPKRDLYWVVGEDGKHHSKDPMPLEKAKKQMAALYIAMKNEKRGGEYPVPPPRGPKYFDTVEATGYNKGFEDEFKKMAANNHDPIRRQGWNRAQERNGMPTDDKAYDEFIKLMAEIAQKRIQQNPVYTPKELAEEKKRQYEYSDWQERYKEWELGANAYYAQHPEEKMVIPPLDENANKITLSREDWKKLPKISQGEAKRRLDIYKQRNKTGWQKFSEGLMNTLAGFTDSAVGVVSSAVPGGDVLRIGYETFAPPGSDYYNEGTAEEKFNSLPDILQEEYGAPKRKKRTINRGKGAGRRKMKGGRPCSNMLCEIGFVGGIVGFSILVSQAATAGSVAGAIATLLAPAVAGTTIGCILDALYPPLDSDEGGVGENLPPRAVVVNVLHRVAEAYHLPVEPPTSTYEFPPGSEDAVRDDLDAGLAYLMTPHRMPPQSSDFLTPHTAQGMVRALPPRTIPLSGGLPSYGPLINPLTRAPITRLTPVIISIGDTHVEVAPAAAAESDDTVITVNPLHAKGRKGRGGRVSPPKLHKNHLMLGGGLPEKNLLQQMAVAAYAPNPPSHVGEYVLLKSTPGLKFYKNPTHPEIVVAIKGTDDWKDLKADLQIGVQSLAFSARFKEDVAALKNFQAQYRASEYTYYGVGHSLGGAILDEFLKMGLVQKGLSYNPAIQPGDIRRTDIDNHRIYKQGDFLYKLMGQFSMSPEVRSKSLTGYVGSFFNPLDPFMSHTLDNFVGGRRPATKFQKQLKAAKVSPEAYLKRAQAKAKKQGLAWKHLGFSSDDTHKLQIPNASGKVVRFGSVGLGDHILYTLSHEPSADEHRRRYLARATKIKGDWKSDQYSPNSLAIHVLW